MLTDAGVALGRTSMLLVVFVVSFAAGTALESALEAIGPKNCRPAGTRDGRMYRALISGRRKKSKHDAFSCRIAW